uniref:C-type lectin domain-containing protein n=1 Tax=Podarcis muralis TaxID=64176 RepID=A0A670K1A6_PODMU
MILEYWNYMSILGLCSDGWTAFKHGCYKVNKESKPWSVARQSCELFSSGARLVDIKNKEEHAFLTSYLRSFSHVIMLWTGLNDIKVSWKQWELTPSRGFKPPTF